MTENDDINNLAIKLKGKTVLVNNTFEEHSLGYYIASVVRNYAETTICSDSRYRMSNEKEGFRTIENGKVILTKLIDKYEIEKKIKTKINLEILIK